MGTIDGNVAYIHLACVGKEEGMSSVWVGGGVRINLPVLYPESAIASQSVVLRPCTYLSGLG